MIDSHWFTRCYFIAWLLTFHSQLQVGPCREGERRTSRCFSACWSLTCFQRCRRSLWFVRLLHSAVPVNSVELNTETLGEVVLETKLLRGWLQILELVSTCKSFDDTKDSMNFSSREYLFQDLNHFKIIFPCLLKGWELKICHSWYTGFRRHRRSAWEVEETLRVGTMALLPCIICILHRLYAVRRMQFQWILKSWNKLKIYEKTKNRACKTKNLACD